MLKTLALIACVALTSIWGGVRYFDYLNQTVAEDVIQNIKKRAVVASPQRMAGRDIDLSEFYLKQQEDMIRAEYLVTTNNSYRGENDRFTITVHNIPQTICEHILTTPWDWPQEIVLNGAEAGSGGYCTSRTQMTFVFVNNLKHLLPLEGSELITHPCDNVLCPFDTTCVDGKCLCNNGEERCGDVCCAIPNTCQDGTCVCDTDWQKIFARQEELARPQMLLYGLVCHGKNQHPKEGIPTPSCLDYEVSYKIFWKGCSWETEWISAHKPSPMEDPTDIDDIEVRYFPEDAEVHVACRAKLLPNVSLLDLGQRTLCGLIPLQ